jgi:hypothetical protein
MVKLLKLPGHSGLLSMTCPPESDQLLDKQLGLVLGY